MLIINFSNLLVDKYSPNFIQDGMTALIYACFYGNINVRMLLDHGAVIDHCNEVKDLEHVATHNLTDH